MAFQEEWYHENAPSTPVAKDILEAKAPILSWWIFAATKKNSLSILGAREFLFFVETTLENNGKRYSRCCERKEECTFLREKESILYNSLIISTYKIGKRKRVTNWRRVNQQVQNYKTYLKNSHFGVEKFNFSLGLSFNFFCIDIILLSV